MLFTRDGKIQEGKTLAEHYNAQIWASAKTNPHQ